jgi:TonB family protein
MWSLGVTLVEALTQELPLWDSESEAAPVVPDSLPKPFDEIALECLRIDPARRSTLSDVRALLEGKSKQAPPRVMSEAPTPPKIAQKSPRTRMPLVPLIVGSVLLAAIMIGLALRGHKTETLPLQTETIKQAPPAEPEAQVPEATPPAPAPTAPASPTTMANAKGEVLDRVMPDVSRQASNTIQGTVTVAVRVTADMSGAVTDAEFASRGPSAYFARMAMESARKWKFKAPVQNGQAVPSAWLLRYKFRRDGVDVSPEQAHP